MGTTRDKVEEYLKVNPNLTGIVRFLADEIDKLKKPIKPISYRAKVPRKGKTAWDRKY